jgi:hypothetical protein
VSVYRNRRTGACVIQASARWGGAWGEIGAPVVVSEEDFEAKIGLAITQAFETSQTQRYDPQSARRVSQEEYGQFVRNHVCVGIALLEGNRIELLPCKRKGRGFVSIDEAKIVFPKTEFEAQLPGWLRQAFELCE